MNKQHGITCVIDLNFALVILARVRRYNASQFKSNLNMISIFVCCKDMRGISPQKTLLSGDENVEQ